MGRQAATVGRSQGRSKIGAALVLGVPVDDVTMDEAVDVVFELVERGRASGRCHQVATVNVDFVVNAVHDHALGALMRRTSLAIPDGMPIVWGSRVLGTPLSERVAGADLVAAIVERAARVGSAVALYGAAPGVAERAADVLEKRHPGARLVASGGPMFDTVDELRAGDLGPLPACDPDICLVAFGNPKQERFIARFGPELGIPVMIGVGGSFDFLVGAQRRAPRWMQRMGLEWLFRAATERRLIGRYVRDAIVFFPRLAGQAWTGRRGREAGSATFLLDDEHGVIDLSALRRAGNRTAADIAGALRDASRMGGAVEVRGGARTSLRDVPGLAELVDDHRSDDVGR